MRKSPLARETSSGGSTYRPLAFSTPRSRRSRLTDDCVTSNPAVLSSRARSSCRRTCPSRRMRTIAWRRSSCWASMAGSIEMARMHKFSDIVDIHARTVKGAVCLFFDAEHQVRAPDLAGLGADRPVIAEAVAEADSVQLLGDADAVAHVEAG